MRSTFLITCGTLAMAVVGCESTIRPDGAAEAVTKVVSDNTGFRPSDVSCPAGVKSEVGAEFECTFTGPDGDYAAHVQITEVSGDDVDFYIRSERR